MASQPAVGRPWLRWTIAAIDFTAGVVLATIGVVLIITPHWQTSDLSVDLDFSPAVGAALALLGLLVAVGAWIIRPTRHHTPAPPAATRGDDAHA